MKKAVYVRCPRCELNYILKDEEKLPYHDEVQARFGFDNNTMRYLSSYKYAKALLKKLATKK